MRAEEPTRTVAVSALSADGAAITVLSGSSKGRTVRVPAEVGASVAVGKAEDNDLVVDDSTVSRRHLLVTRTIAGIQISDCKSTNGLRVGGARVTEALVEPGTVFRAGDVELVLRIEPEAVELPLLDEPRFGPAVGASVAMRRIFALLAKIAPTDVTVLLMGETGTGKDVLARAIHAASKRSSAPFVVVDCGAISPTLIESELFGHERGAFTGASTARDGMFVAASGGTLFLDEVGELSLDVQPKLLRAIEAREVRRVGSNQASAVDVRIIAATKRDLRKEVEGGRFREDLFFRLSVVPIVVPPLRERPDDLPLLIASICRGLGIEPPFDEDALERLRRYDWPGNVRELRNAIERAAHIGLAAFGLSEAAPLSTTDDVLRFRPGTTYKQARARVEAAFEREYVRWLLARHGGNLSAAAREAKMDRKYLNVLARRHRLVTRPRDES